MFLAHGGIDWVLGTWSATRREPLMVMRIMSCEDTIDEQDKAITEEEEKIGYGE